MPEFGDYTAATTLGDTDLALILQGGVTKKITGANMKTSIFNTPTIVTPTIASFVNATHDHEDAAGGGALAMAAVTGLSAAIAAKQDGDADLTTIAGLSPSNDDILQRKAGGWVNRTIAQLKTDLSLSGTNTGDQVISDATITTTDILTNNVSITKHGFAPKLPNDATKYLDGTGAYTVPAGGGGGTPGGSDTQLQYNAASSFGGISGATSDGTNVVYGSGNLRATSPRFTTAILDSNGNELFLLTATGSAVNELTVANAATGNNPTLAASGGDTNIGITLTPKGSKDVSVIGGLLAADFGNGSGQLSYGFTSSPTSGMWWQSSGGANGQIHLRNNGNDYLSVGAGMVTIAAPPKFSGTNTTGAGSAALGSNSPAVTNSAPYTWIQITTSDGSTAYIPAWK